VLTADIRHAVWAAAQDAAAAGELPAMIPEGSHPADPSTLRPAGLARYASTLPYLLATPDCPPRQAAQALAARVAAQPWISAVTPATGHLTVTVTDDALAALAVRVTRAPAPAASDILRGLPVPAAPPADLAAAPSWAEAGRRLSAEVIARLARTAGAEIDNERLRPPQPPTPAAPHSVRTQTALGYAGPDALAWALLTHEPGWQPDSLAELPVKNSLGNPVYAVQYAHAHAASTLRQAADLGLSRGEAVAFAPSLLGQPAERALLGTLSWLPERVAWAARRGRPGDFARYLGELAGAHQDCREQCPALPFGGHSAPRQEDMIRARLWLVSAASAAIAAGLALLGISAPGRL
jgi:DALR anticodon binding domain